MVVNEIFGSIDGEGIRAGELASFVRLAGCNLRCSYCDTQYALDKNAGTEMSVNEIIDELDKIGIKNVTLTGGEPLQHKDIDILIEELLKSNYKVNIETNGSINIEKYVGKCLITMDYKCPSSNMENTMNLANIEKLGEEDVLKFVVEESDLKTVEEVLRKFKIKSFVYISPIYQKIKLPKIVEFMKKCNSNGIDMTKVRMQIQLHKVIWNPDMRGV